MRTANKQQIRPKNPKTLRTGARNPNTDNRPKISDIIAIRLIVRYGCASIAASVASFVSVKKLVDIALFDLTLGRIRRDVRLC